RVATWGASLRAPSLLGASQLALSELEWVHAVLGRARTPVRAVRVPKRRAADCPPYQRFAQPLSTSYGTGRQPARFAQACCKAPPHAASVIREPEFDVPSKNSTSRAAREGTRPFHARAQR